MEPATSRPGFEQLNSDFLYGWDLLFKTVEGKIDKKSDILIVLVHFLLTKHYKFRCVGIGDDVSIYSIGINVIELYILLYINTFFSRKLFPKTKSVPNYCQITGMAIIQSTL